MSIGIRGRKGQRNAPTILNALYNKAQFWDGRVKTLEEQAAMPIVNSFEMGQATLDAAVEKIVSTGLATSTMTMRREFTRAVRRSLFSPALAGAARIAAPTTSSNCTTSRGPVDNSAFDGRCLCRACHRRADIRRRVRLLAR